MLLIPNRGSTLGVSSEAHMATLEEAVEILAPASGTEALLLDLVVPSLPLIRLGHQNMFLGFLVQKIPVSTSLSTAQDSSEIFF